MIYLATPYSDPDWRVREARYRTVTKVTADLVKEGEHVFSPITHLHDVIKHGDLSAGWDYWKEFDRKMIGVCERFMILRLPGWEKSVGVMAEVGIATDLGRTIECIDHELLPIPQGRLWKEGAPREGVRVLAIESGSMILATGKDGWMWSDFGERFCTVPRVECYIEAELIRALRTAGQEAEVRTWCPFCGPDVRVTESGYCESCGAMATGPHVGNMNYELMERDLHIEQMKKRLGPTDMLRHDVLWFAQRMEEKLRENDHKGGWEGEDNGYLLDRVKEEVAELEEEIGMEDLRYTGQLPSCESDPREGIIWESVDTANMAMMIASNQRRELED